MKVYVFNSNFVNLNYDCFFALATAITTDLESISTIEMLNVVAGTEEVQTSTAGAGG